MRAEREPVLQILKTAHGQLAAIIRMVEENRYCVDIANQNLAVQALLKKANRMVLAAHLQGCVQEAVQAQDSTEKIQEILALVERMTTSGS